MRITITKRDGTVRKYPPGKTLLGYPIGEPEAKSIDYVLGFVIVTDGYGATIAIPTADIAEITIDPPARGF